MKDLQREKRRNPHGKDIKVKTLLALVITALTISAGAAAAKAGLLHIIPVRGGGGRGEINHIEHIPTPTLEPDPIPIPEPTPVLTPVIDKVTLPGKGSGNSSDFQLKLGMNIFRIDIKNSADNGTRLWLQGNDYDSGELFFSLYEPDRLHCGDFQGDIVLGANAYEDDSFEPVGTYHLEVISNGTWTVVEEHMVGVQGRVLPQTISGDGHAVYSMNITHNNRPENIPLAMTGRDTYVR